MGWLLERGDVKYYYNKRGAKKKKKEREHPFLCKVVVPFFLLKFKN
jgi:hypothetical protein